MQSGMLVLGGARERNHFARAGDVGVRFSVDDLLDRARVVGPVIIGGAYVEAREDDSGRVVADVRLRDDTLALQIEDRFYRGRRDDMERVVVKLCDISESRDDVGRLVLQLVEL